MGCPVYQVCPVAQCGPPGSWARASHAWGTACSHSVGSHPYANTLSCRSDATGASSSTPCADTHERASSLCRTSRQWVGLLNCRVWLHHRVHCCSSLVCLFYSVPMWISPVHEHLARVDDCICLKVTCHTRIVWHADVWLVLRIVISSELIKLSSEERPEAINMIRCGEHAHWLPTCCTVLTHLSFTPGVHQARTRAWTTERLTLCEVDTRPPTPLTKFVHELLRDPEHSAH